MTTIPKKCSVIPQSEVKIYCGIDIHKQQITVALFGRDLTQLEFCKSEVFATDPAGLQAMWTFTQRYKPIGYAMEATGVYHHPVADFLQCQLERLQITFEIYIVNPADVAGLPGQQQRNDRLDAIQIARYYAAGLLKNGRTLVPPLEDLKALFRMNLRLERDKTALKNRIHKTLDRAGFRPKGLNLNADWTLECLRVLTLQSGSIAAFLEDALSPESSLKSYVTYIRRAAKEWVRFGDINISSAQRALIRQDLYELGLKCARITLLKLEIETGLRQQPVLCDQAHRLASLPGITPYTAVWMLTELGGIERFPNIRKFLTYCGCVPRSEISAETVYSCHLTRHSNKFLRTMFYQAAVIVGNIVKVNSPLKEYASLAMLQKSGSMKLAYCKTMAKMARLCYGMLKSQSKFDLQKFNANPKKSKGEFTILEQKQLTRAKRYLQRIREIKGLAPISDDISQLIVSLEETLKKESEG